MDINQFSKRGHFYEIYQQFNFSCSPKLKAPYLKKKISHCFHIILLLMFINPCKFFIRWNSSKKVFPIIKYSEVDDTQCHKRVTRKNVSLQGQSIGIVCIYHRNT